jgi:hypothetical protein
MLNKRTLVSGIAAVALAGGVMAQSTAPAAARDWDHHHYYRHYDGGGAAIGAGIFGLAAGAMIGGALAPRNVYYGDYYDPYYDGYEPYYYRPAMIYRYGPPVGVYRSGYGHVARCEARYRTYDPRTNTFVGYDGRLHYCRF